MLREITGWKRVKVQKVNAGANSWKNHSMNSGSVDDFVYQFLEESLRSNVTTICLWMTL